ncbi:hypothetical protein ACFYS8_36305 [Kitasatospora sp. NPDC004615]|uniref:hypothetical protein n=1 Tax=Kitasatospora sp. NPDC004615 TaxID=3364017 RepID=UPI0036A938A6
MPLRTSGRQQLYCRRSCRQRAYEARVRNAELKEIHTRQQARLDRILGTLGPAARTQAAEAAAVEPPVPTKAKAKTRKSRKPAAETVAPKIEGQEELTW